MNKKLIMLAAVFGCAMTLSAQGPLKKTKMSPWLLNKYQQQQTAVKQNGGPLKVKGRIVRNYILTLVESTDEAAAIRAKGGVVLQDFGQGICAAFLPTDIPGLSHHQPAGLTFRVEGSTLYIDGLDGEAPITLFDLTGRPVLQTVTSGTLRLPSLAAGVYAVQLGQLGSTLIRL